MSRDGSQVVQGQEVAGTSVRTPPAGISCEGCGAMFRPRRPSQRYCRPACRAVAQRQREHDRLSGLLERLVPDDPGRAE